MYIFEEHLLSLSCTFKLKFDLKKIFPLQLNVGESCSEGCFAPPPLLSYEEVIDAI